MDHINVTPPLTLSSYVLSLHMVVVTTISVKEKKKKNPVMWDTGKPNDVCAGFLNALCDPSSHPLLWLVSSGELPYSKKFKSLNMSDSIFFN